MDVVLDVDEVEPTLELDPRRTDWDEGSGISSVRVGKDWAWDWHSAAVTAGVENESCASDDADMDGDASDMAADDTDTDVDDVVDVTGEVNVDMEGVADAGDATGGGLTALSLVVDVVLVALVVVMMVVLGGVAFCAAALGNRNGCGSVGSGMVLLLDQYLIQRFSSRAAIRKKSGMLRRVLIGSEEICALAGLICFFSPEDLLSTRCGP